MTATAIGRIWLNGWGSSERGNPSRPEMTSANMRPGNPASREREDNWERKARTARRGLTVSRGVSTNPANAPSEAGAGGKFGGSIPCNGGSLPPKYHPPTPNATIPAKRAKNSMLIVLLTITRPAPLNRGAQRTDSAQAYLPVEFIQ